MKAMVLAAGKGTRLRELTRNRPKCLITVGGQTLLARVFGELKRVGVAEVVINLHYLAEQVRDFVAAHDNFGLKLHFSYESELLDTGGGIRQARRWLDGSEPFFVYNADIFSDVDLLQLRQSHQERGALATLAVRECQTPRYLLCSEHREIVGWSNADSGMGKIVAGSVNTKPVTFMGVHIASPAVFAWFEREQPPFSIFTPYFKAVQAGELLSAHFAEEAFWSDIGTPESLTEISANLNPASS